MSNERKSPDAACAHCSPSSSPVRTSSIDGATTTPFDSNTPCCMSASSDTGTSSGESSQGRSAGRLPPLAQWVAVSDYAARVTDIALRVARATEQATVLALLREGATALGAECAVFVSFVRDSADVSACRFMLACKPDWCRRYLASGLIAHDLWLAYAAHHSEPILANMLNATEPLQQQAIDLATQNGFVSAVLVPAHSGAGHSRISLLCLGCSAPGYFADEGFGPFRVNARVLAMELHEWWLARIRRELIVKSHITPSDLILLRHEFLGHSSKRIAAELHVSKSSINSRFQRMNTKLGVANRRMAARLAVECGLILT
jgi:DNA-binding CsgD family transcriptional regulator